MGCESYENCNDKSEEEVENMIDDYTVFMAFEALLETEEKKDFSQLGEFSWEK